MFSLIGKVAVVTGGAGGIGFATVQRFRAAGAQVIMSDLGNHEARAEEVGAVYHACDVSNEIQVGALMQRALDAFGQLDIAVNNAGIVITGETILEARAETYQKQYDINLMSQVYGMREAANRMKPGASIINTASISANRVASGAGAYACDEGGHGLNHSIGRIGAWPEGHSCQCYQPVNNSHRNGLAEQAQYPGLSIGPDRAAGRNGGSHSFPGIR